MCVAEESYGGGGLTGQWRVCTSKMLLLDGDALTPVDVTLEFSESGGCFSMANAGRVTWLPLFGRAAEAGDGQEVSAMPCGWGVMFAVL